MGKLGKRCGPLVCFGLMLLGAAGCGTLGESIGLSTPNNPLLKDAKAIRDAAPVPAPGGRELAKELLPTHIVEPGDTLLVQPVELDAPVRLPPDQPVQPDGTIDLGVYGRPVVAGKTLAQIEVLIKDVIKAHDKGKDFPVTVRLLGRPGKVFYVLGEVNAPGAFPLTGRETVLDGIIAAGGVTRRASLGNIILSRPTFPDSCRIVYPVCYQQITQLGDTTTNYQLQPGDRIFVPSKGLLEGILPPKCQHPAGACSRPQVPCYDGICPPGALDVPHVPPPGGSVKLGPAVNHGTPAASCSGGACPAPLTTVRPLPVPAPAPVPPVSSLPPVVEEAALPAAPAPIPPLVEPLAPAGAPIPTVPPVPPVPPPLPATLPGN